MEEPRRPRFFKVLVVDFARRIEIPQGFLCHFPEGRDRKSGTTVAPSAEVVLTNAEGNIWPVELEEIDGRVFLTTGWPKFVEDNSLGKGEFLIFKYYGRMHFMVSVFGVNAVEKAGWSSGSGAQATENVEELPCPIIPSRKGVHRGNKLTETIKSHMHSHSQVDILDHSHVGMEIV